MNVGTALDLMAVGSFGVMGLITLLFYAVRRRELTPLWLGIFCFVFAGHFMFRREPTLGPVADYLSLALLALFIGALYPRYCPRSGVAAVGALGVLGALATIVLPRSLHGFVAAGMQGVTLVACAWLAFVLASVAWHRRSAWSLLLVAMPLLFPVIVWGLLVDNLALRYAIAPFGIVAFIIAPVVVLSRRLASALNFEAEKTREQRGRADELDQELRRQSRMHTDVVDNVPVGLSLRDREGKYLFVNNVWCKWFGGPRAAVVGSYVQDRVAPHLAREILALDREALDRGPGAPQQVVEIEFKGRRYTQTRSVLMDEDGGVMGVLVGSIDTTERFAEQQQLKDQMVLMRALIDENPNPMYLKDTEGRYVTLNDAFLKMTRLTREQAVGRKVHEVFPDADAERLHQQDMQILAQGQGWNEIESLRRNSDGEPRWMLVRKAALRRADGEVIGLIGTNTDITRLKQVEKELADRNKFITEVIEALPVSVVIRDTEGRHVQVNRAWERYYNVKREDILGKRFIEFPGWKKDPELVEFARAADDLDRQSLARGPENPLEPMERRRKGRVYLNTRRALADTAGNPVGVVGVSLDVTDQRIMAEILAMEQRRLALVVRATEAGIVDWDGVTHATYYSPRFREILGHPPDADTSQWPDYFKVLVHPDDRERITRRFQDFVKGKGPEGKNAEFLPPHEYRLQRKDGSHVWVQASGIATRNEKGFVTRWIAAVIDITERRKQDLRMREQSTILETTFENIDQGITMIDRNLRVIAHNRRFLELLDFPPDVFNGPFTLEQAFRYNAARGEYGPGDPEEQVRTRLELARKFEPHAFERTRPNGMVLAIRGQPLPGGGGFVTTYTDVTEQKRAEEELKASMRMREEVERLSRHDLKTPINSVIAVSRLLRENKRIAKEDADLLATVERAGYRILDMVNLSLDLFRMEQGIYEFRPRAIDLDEVAAKVATDLQSQAASKNVHVTVKRNREAIARAEELLCYSIFANLVKNAIEAAPEGTTVSITLDREDERAVCRVHNVGVVPDHIRSRFFQKYQTAGKSAGLGLGTYSAQLLARVQGGKLTLNTSATEGTTLTVRLQAANPDEIKLRREAAPSPVDSGAIPHLPALRVLIADDDEFNRLVLQRYLPSPPLKVALAVNGRAAVDAVAREWPDVVLLDLEMPVMDGYEAAKRLREIEQEQHRKRLLIVAISSNDEEAIVQRALAAGCDHYLVKPARRELLWQILSGASVPLASGGTPAAPTAPSDEILLDPDLEAALPGFLASRREALDEMARALEAGDREAFKRLAHRLAGSFALYGFKWAAIQAKALERDAAEGEAGELAARTAVIRGHLDTVYIRIATKNAVTP
jgi:PAS domain S-box-containing protein